jgi:hypothetical protein
LNLDYWVINDLHTEFKECSIKLVLNGKVINSLKIDKIEKDSVKFISWENLQILLPIKIKCGRYKLNIELYSGSLLSVNDFEIEIDRKK